MSKMERQWDLSTQAFGEPPRVNEARQARRGETEGEVERKTATSTRTPVRDLNLEELERLQQKMWGLNRVEREGLEGEALVAHILDPYSGLRRLTIDELYHLGDQLLSLLRLVSMTGEVVKTAPHSGACRNTDRRTIGECSRCVALGYYRRARGVC